MKTNVPSLDALYVIPETIFEANLLTGAKSGLLSYNHYYHLHDGTSKLHKLTATKYTSIFFRTRTELVLKWVQPN